MHKQLKLITTMGAFALAMAAVTPAMGAASGTMKLAGQHFFTMNRMKMMAANKDGMVSRDEFMAYMGKSYDMMDQNKDKMLDSKEFMDKKMMHTAFPTMTQGNANGSTCSGRRQNRLPPAFFIRRK